MYFLATFNSVQKFRKDYFVPPNAGDLINRDLKQYCSAQILQSFISAEYALNPSSWKSEHKVILSGAEFQSGAAKEFLAKNTDLSEQSVRLFRQDEIIQLMHYALFMRSKKPKETHQLNLLDPMYLPESV